MKTTSRRFVYIPKATDVVREQPASHNQQAETGNRATKRQWWRRLAVLPKATDCGLEGSILNKLPVELVERIVLHCGAKELATLEATCRFFVTSDMVQRSAQAQLSTFSWTSSLALEEGETWVSLLQYARSSAAADAQATSLSLGSYHTAVILTLPHPRQGHCLATFGRGFHGQLGQGEYSDSTTPGCRLAGPNPLLIGGLSKEQALIERPAVMACGREHSAAISGRGQLFTWGLAASGELGRAEGCGTATPGPAYRAPPSLVFVGAGGNHTLAISKTGVLYACGKNQQGQLGVNSFEDQHQLQPVQNLGQNKIFGVAAGEAHSVAVGMDGMVWTWGQGHHGQLGDYHCAQFLENYSDLSLPVFLPRPQPLGWFCPHRLPENSRITSVAAGGNNTMVKTVGGALLAFGQNKYGCLGVGDTASRTVPTQVALSHLQGERQAPIRVVQIACGKHHTLILAHCGGKTMVCSAGNNLFGQLGVKSPASRDTFSPVPELAGKNIVVLACGDDHSAAVSSSGELYLWGRGLEGQLGQGDERSRHTPTLLPHARVVHPNVTLRRRDPPLRCCDSLGSA